MLSQIRNTLLLRSFGFFKVPLIAWVRPRVLELTEEKCVIRIPLFRRTRNHLGSMYFGALSIGADCAGGLIAMWRIRELEKEGKRISLVFKDFQARFLKRPLGDVDFICEQGKELNELVRRAADSSERVELPVQIRALAHPPGGPTEECANFVLTISLKKKD